MPLPQSAREEIKLLLDSEILFPSYTHLTSNTARSGIEKTGRLMSISVAMSNGIVPFSGEAPFYPPWFSYLLRAFYVSLSRYPSSDEHSWKMYKGLMLAYTPQLSQGIASSLEEKLASIDQQPYSFADFQDPRLRQNLKIKVRACLEFEKQRQKAFEGMSESDREKLKDPKPDIYLFDSRLDRVVTYSPFGLKEHIAHPIVPGDLNLSKYLIGMITSGDVYEAKKWVVGVVKREIPAASVDAFAMWEDLIVPRLSSFREFPNLHSFYSRLTGTSNAHRSFRERVRNEALQLL